MVQEAFKFSVYMFVAIKLPVLAWELMLGFISGGQDIYPPQHMKDTHALVYRMSATSYIAM